MEPAFTQPVNKDHSFKMSKQGLFVYNKIRYIHVYNKNVYCWKISNLFIEVSETGRKRKSLASFS
jgi:hypothetical protein